MGPMGPMGSHGYPWGPMGTHGSPWVPTGTHRSPCVLMGTHGPPWVPMGSHEDPWVPMGHHGFPWVPMGPNNWIFARRPRWPRFVAILSRPLSANTRMKNRKIKKPYIKVVRDSCLWVSGRWEWWEIILGWVPSKFRDIWSYRTSETLCFVIFSILGRGPRKVNDLLISPSNQFRDYFI